MAENRLKNNVKVVLIGGSSGSIDVLMHLLPALQPPLSFALLIVIHRRNTSDPTLANLFSLKTRVPVQEVEDKEDFLPGHLYLAPADYHVLFEPDGTLALDDSEKVHYSRPAIDVSFETAADVFGPSVVGILLSGASVDGTEGLRAIRNAGGTTIVQRPETAQSSFMPDHALRSVPVDFVFDVPELVRYVQSLHTD